MVTPRITVPWPATPREWQLHAVCSQLRADGRRQQAREDRQEFWRELRIDLEAAVLGVLCATALVGLRMLAAL